MFDNKKLLLLSSSHLIWKENFQLFGKSIKKYKISWITTASKGVGDTSYIDDHKEKIAELGFDFEELDIDNKNENELREILKKKDVIFINGGNTFYLLKSIRESKFDKVIKKFIDRGGIYIGSSAGSYVACPTIEMATWKDQNIDYNFGVTNFSALNLIPFLVVAHYNPKNNELLKEKLTKTKYSVRLLTDEQAIIVNGDDVEFMGEELKIN